MPAWRLNASIRSSSQAAPVACHTCAAGSQPCSRRRALSRGTCSGASAQDSRSRPHDATGSADASSLSIVAECLF